MHEYATFLHEIRRNLPTGMQLSITALLDWFRDGTAIAEVMKEVDEFVPQFYDISDPERSAGGIRLGMTQRDDIRPIAAKIDAAVWAPRFNKYAKRYRIGISSFGRSAEVSGSHLRVYSDLTPLAIAGNSAFTLQTERTPAHEILLKYGAVRKTKMSYETFEAGDLVEFAMPTSESLRDAYDNAKRMGGYCEGVLFFRWPIPDHEIALSPAEVLKAIGADGIDLSMPRLVAKDGGCAAVRCVDLHLFNVDSKSNVPLRYKVTSSVPFEYFFAFVPGERDLRDMQEERWRAYLILNDIVERSGKTPLGRKAARLALRCLRGIATERFGRETQIEQADIRISNWLQH